MLRGVIQYIDNIDFKHWHKTNQFSNIIVFQVVVLTTLDRLKTDMYSLCIGSALVSLRNTSLMLPLLSISQKPP